MSVLVSIAGLAFLILIHEAGHFFTARGVGMKPRRFYIGFPPAVLKTTRNGIEYGLGAIPLGGYVRHRPGRLRGRPRGAAGARARNRAGAVVGERETIRRPRA